MASQELSPLFSMRIELAFPSTFLQTAFMFRSLTFLLCFCACLTPMVWPLFAADRAIDLARTPSGDVRFEIQGLVVPTKTAQSILEEPPRQFDSVRPSPLDLLKAASQAVVFSPASITLAPNAIGGVSLTPVGKKGSKPTMRIDLVHRHECVALDVTQTAPKLLARPVFMTTDSFDVTYHSTRVFTGPLKNQPELTLYLQIRTTPGNPSLSFRLPRLEFNRHSIREALGELCAQSRKLNPTGKAFNFVLDTYNIREDLSAEITSDFTGLPIGEAIEYVGELAGCRLKYNKHAVIIEVWSWPTLELYTRTVKLPKGLAQVMAAETPAIWLTQNCMRPNEFSSDSQPHLNQESETLTVSLLDKVHTRLSLLLRIQDDTSQPILLPKPWRKAMSIHLPHVQLRTGSLKQALSDLLPHLKGKNAPSIVIDPNDHDAGDRRPRSVA